MASTGNAVRPVPRNSGPGSVEPASHPMNVGCCRRACANDDSRKPEPHTPVGARMRTSSVGPAIILTYRASRHRASCHLRRGIIAVAARGTQRPSATLRRANAGKRSTILAWHYPDRQAMSDPSTPPLFPGLQAPAARAAVGAAATSTHEVAKAMALLWTYRPRSAIFDLLPLLGLKRHDGRAFTQDDVKRAVAELRERGWLREMPGRDGYFRLQDERARPLVPRAAGRSAGRSAARGAAPPRPFRLRAPRRTTGRCTTWRRPSRWFASSSSRERPRRSSSACATSIQRSLNWNEIVWTAAFPAFDAALFERITPEWRWDLAFAAVTETVGRVARRPAAGLRVGARQARRRARRHAGAPALGARRVARASRRGRALQHALAGSTAARPTRCARAVLVQQGAGAKRRRHSRRRFEAAPGRDRRAQARASRRAWPGSIRSRCSRSRRPRHLELARKFCLGEAGKRNPDPRDAWGRWVHAIGARLGDVALDKQRLRACAAPGRLHRHRRPVGIAARGVAGRDAIGPNRAPSAARRDAVAEYAASCGKVLAGLRLRVARCAGRRGGGGARRRRAAALSLSRAARALAQRARGAAGAGRRPGRRRATRGADAAGLGRSAEPAWRARVDRAAGAEARPARLEQAQAVGLAQARRQRAPAALGRQGRARDPEGPRSMRAAIRSIAPRRSWR